MVHPVVHRQSPDKFNGNGNLLPNVSKILTGLMLLVTASSVCRHADAADRTSCIVPQAGEERGAPIEDSVFPDQAFGDAASEGWKAYIRLWKAHHADPADANIRRFLGLPLTGLVEAKSKRGRSAPRWLGWRSGSYQQIDTPHFTIYSRASADQGRHVAEDLESCYWIWTQMFFPFWEAAAGVSTVLAGLADDTDVKEFLGKKPSRLSVRRKLRVVLFRDAAEYRQTLGKEIPGIERSTGFYSDQRQTTFLYGSAVDDAATRRHEMVHQLFREAARSTLGRTMPGEDKGFWIVEGIAGYFESLTIDRGLATLGGWDASRLQFARYRLLVAGDTMTMSELAADGRIAAQRREDLARWYAHAIAQTHHLLDSGMISHRRYIYQNLANCYAIKVEIPGAGLSGDPERLINSFLSINDSHLKDNQVPRPLARLCLAGCEVSEDGLSLISPSPNIQWLDLSRLPIGNDAVRRLAPNPRSILQLTLEATKVDSGLGEWLAKATNLQELDLSWTPMDDQIIDSLSGATQIETLWMTGTRLSDQSIEPVARMKSLQAVDLQRTKVTAAGLEQLRKARPDLSINPLELR